MLAYLPTSLPCPPFAPSSFARLIFCLFDCMSATPGLAADAQPSMFFRESASCNTCVRLSQACLYFLMLLDDYSTAFFVIYVLVLKLSLHFFFLLLCVFSCFQCFLHMSFILLSSTFKSTYLQFSSQVRHFPAPLIIHLYRC
ncbi:hypothetical protein GOODEAATRI_002209 [Goodea atripinnis]|uniref:Uncharacterized protein n=1 Tax=Goodea atripinnis TaxID=208336 RepID=A0ABV0NHW0_9TELE